MRTGSNLSGLLSVYKQTVVDFETTPELFEHVADIDDDFKIFVSDKTYNTSNSYDYYVITLPDDKPVAVFLTTYLTDNEVLLDIAYVDETARGNKLSEKFCWFLKTRMTKKIVMVEYQSPSAVELMKSLHRSKRFVINWEKDGKHYRMIPRPSIQMDPTMVPPMSLGSRPRFIII